MIVPDIFLYLTPGILDIIPSPGALFVIFGSPDLCSPKQGFMPKCQP
jgi:hypothetical protein